MKFDIAILVILLTLAEAVRVQVKLNTLIGFSGSPFEITTARNKKYRIRSRKELGVGSIYLKMRYQPKDSDGQPEELEADFCDDTPAKEAAMAEIVRESLRMKCPTEDLTYSANDNFRYKGNVGNNEKGTQFKLLVAAFRSEDGTPDESQRYFSASYDITFL